MKINREFYIQCEYIKNVCMAKILDDKQRKEAEREIEQKERETRKSVEKTTSKGLNNS